MHASCHRCAHVCVACALLQVKLWDGLALDRGAVATWEGATKASFSSNATKVGWEGAAAGARWLCACVCA